MRILIVTDAWFPQINGVVRTLNNLKENLIKEGHEVCYITPDLFYNLPCPTYPEIRLSIFPKKKFIKIFQEFSPNAVHIATEGPLGITAKRYFTKNNIPFSTAFHTRFPEYLNSRFNIPISFGYRLIRWFHYQSQGIMVATQSIEDELNKHNIRKVNRWTRGVDTELFFPRKKSNKKIDILGVKRPIHLYVGRVSIEKNIESFLDLELPGSKLVVGDGPQLKELKSKYKDTYFVGSKHGEELAMHYSTADVFVFPSLTDTFGLVILEALASGLPVAAYPVPGPLDIIKNAKVGYLDNNLAFAIEKSLELNPEACRQHALKFSWNESTKQFINNITTYNE